MIEFVLIAVLLIFALISFYDAWKYKKYRSAKKITLQLPDKIKTRIRSIMHKGLQYRFLIPGAFFIGVSVTALESVCTGQVYIPALVLMTREYGVSERWFWYLLLYNIMFILPLLALFAAAYRGTKTKRLLGWSKANVVYSKTVLGIFFAFMAILILLLSI